MPVLVEDAAEAVAFVDVEAASEAWESACDEPPMCFPAAR